MELYKPHIVQFATDDQLYTHARQVISEHLIYITGNEGVARMALSGGSTPMRLYKELSQLPEIEWNRIELFQVDERHIDTDSDASNQKNILNAFDPIMKKELKQFHVFNTSLTLKDCVSAYSEIIDSLDGVKFDITILGIGEDGHFGSIFPHSQYISGSIDSVVNTTAGEGFDVSERLSLSPVSILDSDLIIVLLKGNSKSEITTTLLESLISVKEFPAKMLLAHPRLHIFQSIEEDNSDNSNSF